MIVVNPKKIRNENFKRDFEYDLELNCILLKLIGVWPLSLNQSTTYDRTFALVVKIINSFFIAFLIIPLLCYTFLVEKVWMTRLRILGALNFFIATTVKYVILLFKRKDIASCIDLIASDWQEVGSTICRSLMLENARACRIFTKYCVIACYCGIVVCYTCIFPFIAEPCHRNGTKLRPSPYPSEFYIFDAQLSPMYEIVFFGHLISVAVICAISCSVYTLSVKLVIHTCSHYQIVGAFIQSLDDDENHSDFYNIKCRDEKKRKLANIIQRHLHALTFELRVENILNEISLVNLVEGTGSICFLECHLTAEWRSSNLMTLVVFIMIMISIVFNIFVICYIGQHLSEKRKQVGTTSYMTNWWGLPVSQTRALILIIATSQIPAQFTAGKMVNLSLQTFSSVIQASAAYFNVLHSVM